MGNKPGILLVNLGSPDEPTAKSVRKYLFQFLLSFNSADYASKNTLASLLRMVFMEIF